MTTPSRRWVWLGLLLAAVAAVLLYRHFELGRLLTLESLKASRDALVALYQQAPLLTAASYFGVYVLATALSLPGALVLTLAGGAMFGLGLGLVLVSFASSLGALLAFLAARYLLRDSVQARFGKTLAPINEGVQRDGTLYLLTLRLVPAFPFFMVNLLMGLTPMAAGRFYWVSQLGMLAGTAVYVNAGTQLAAIQSARDILSPGLWFSFVLLGLFPLLAKAIVNRLRDRELYAAAAAAPVQPQPGGHWCGCGRAGHGLHRRGREGQGDAGGRPQDGWRLPELRLRTQQGADPLGQAGASAEPGKAPGLQRCARHGGFPRGDGPHPAGDCPD